MAISRSTAQPRVSCRWKICRGRKWEAFGWHVQEIDGHNIESIIDAASMAQAITNKPSVIIAHTIPGKGVDFMEYDYHWHGAPPNSEQAKEALKKLRTLDGKITHEGQSV